MSKAEPLRKPANYYSIKEGSFRLPSDESVKDAIRREFTNPRTGAKGVVYELGYYSLSGFIQDIKFQDTVLDDGVTLRRLNIVLDPDADGKQQIISMDIDSRYADDFLAKLPSIDLSKEVLLRPFDYKNKKGQRKLGMSVDHMNETGEWVVRVDNFFVTAKKEGDGFVFSYKHGYPEATAEDREDWKFYFQKVNKFLVKYAKENVLPKMSEVERKNQVMDNVLDDVLGSAEKPEYPVDNSNPDDIPF